MIRSLLLPFAYHKYLLSQLTLREVKARYKQSIIGYAWVLINPLSQLIVYSIVFSVFIRFPTENLPYPIFLFSGLLPWIYLQTSVTAATLSLVSNDDLIRKVYFPREVLPYSVILSKILDFFFASLLFVVFIFIFHVSLHPSAFLVIPLFIIQTLLITGLSLMFSTFNLFYRDIQFLINLILLLWMYLSPIIYPTSLVPKKFLWLYTLNPMVGIIEGYRGALFGLSVNMNTVVISVVISLAIFFLGFIIFKKSEKVFADIV